MTTNKKLVYVIGAYSGATPDETKENIAKAEAASITLLCAGYHVITPHKNTAGYEWYEKLYPDLNYALWIEMDLNILSRCDAIYIMPSAKESKGSQIEIEFAREHGIPEVK